MIQEVLYAAESQLSHPNGSQVYHLAGERQGASPAGSTAFTSTKSPGVACSHLAKSEPRVSIDQRERASITEISLSLSPERTGKSKEAGVNQKPAAAHSTRWLLWLAPPHIEIPPFFPWEWFKCNIY